MRRSKLVPVLAALLLVALSGCGAIGGNGDATQTPTGEPVITDDMSAEEIQQLSANATAGYSTYEMRMNMSIQMEQGTVEMVMDGVVNNDARKARMDMSVDAGFQSVDTEAYLDDQMVYVKNPNGGWISEPATGSDSINWEQTNQLEQQRELLNQSEVTVTGSTTIDGVPMTVISIDPDEAAMEELVAQQQTNASDVSISDVSMKMYVANHTAHIRKMELDATMAVDGENAEMDMVVELSNYGMDTNIQIPEEAR